MEITINFISKDFKIKIINYLYAIFVLHFINYQYYFNNKFHLLNYLLKYSN